MKLIIQFPVNPFTIPAVHMMIRSRSWIFMEMDSGWWCSSENQD